MNFTEAVRCPRCGRLAASQDKFCAECGLFLRDAYVDQRLLLALTCEREGQSQEARHEVERLLENEPDHVLANHLLGTLHFHEGLLDQAIEHYKKAVEKAPNFVLAHYDLGVAWYHRGDMLEAARSFQRCLELNSNYHAAHYRLGLALFHAGSLDQARECFELSIVLTPNTSWRTITWAFSMSGGANLKRQHENLNAV